MFCSQHLKSVIADFRLTDFGFSALWLSISLINFTAPLKVIWQRWTLPLDLGVPQANLIITSSWGARIANNTGGCRAWQATPGCPPGQDKPHTGWPATISRWHQAMGTLASWVIQGIASICKISRSFSLIQSKIYIEFTYWAVNTIVFVKMLKHKTQINSLGWWTLHGLNPNCLWGCLWPLIYFELCKLYTHSPREAIYLCLHLTACMFVCAGFFSFFWLYGYIWSWC